MNVAKTAITFRLKGHNFLYTVPQNKQIKLYFRGNPKKFEFLTPLYDEFKTDWPVFKLTENNKNKIPDFIPALKDEIDNIDEIYKTVLSL